jgi:hypothetical protein
LISAKGIFCSIIYGDFEWFDCWIVLLLLEQNITICRSEKGMQKRMEKIILNVITFYRYTGKVQAKGKNSRC